MARIDPYKHEERYKRWKSQGAEIPDMSAANAQLIRCFLDDMELGLNVSHAAKKGPRSFVRLNTLRVRIPSLARRFRKRFGVDCITDATEEQVHVLFNEIQTGKIVKPNGATYASVGDFIKDFKGFWHWHMTARRKQGETVPDITCDLASGGSKPRWVYLTEQQVRSLCDEAKYEYRVLMMFLLDSGVRSPTELVNIRVGDFSEGFQQVHIREETSKTFGRRIKLLLCSDLLKEYVRTKRLDDAQVVFPICPPVANRYFKRLAQRVLGDGTSLAGERYDMLTLYDFRHISACYWLPRYKSEAALKYRFGWKRTERIYYYTELLGMRDTISSDDVLLDADKTELERRLVQSERSHALLQERLDIIQRQMEQMKALTERLLCRAS